MNKNQNIFSVMNAMMFSGVDRDTENGVKLVNASLFCMGGEKLGITTHLFGNNQFGSCQVCSPIRTIQEVYGGYVFVTRSYNKYCVSKKDFKPVDKDSISVLTYELGDWLGGNKILRVFDSNFDKNDIPLFEGKPTEFEKQFYGC